MDTGTTPPENQGEDQHLVDAALAAGAFDEDERKAVWDRARAASDVLGDPEIKFFPELRKVKFEDLKKEKQIMLITTKIIEGWHSRFGTSDFPLLLVQLESGERVTTAGSGVAILRQVKQLQKIRGFPVKVSIREAENDAGQKYNLFV